MAANDDHSEQQAQIAALSRQKEKLIELVTSLAVSENTTESGSDDMAVENMLEPAN